MLEIKEIEELDVVRVLARSNDGSVSDLIRRWRRKAIADARGVVSFEEFHGRDGTRLEVYALRALRREETRVADMLWFADRAFERGEGPREPVEELVDRLTRVRHIQRTISALWSEVV